MSNGNDTGESVYGCDVDVWLVRTTKRRTRECVKWNRNCVCFVSSCSVCTTVVCLLFVSLLAGLFVFVRPFGSFCFVRSFVPFLGALSCLVCLCVLWA